MSFRYVLDEIEEKGNGVEPNPLFMNYGDSFGKIKFFFDCL